MVDVMFVDFVLVECIMFSCVCFLCISLYGSFLQLCKANLEGYYCQPSMLRCHVPHKSKQIGEFISKVFLFGGWGCAATWHLMVRFSLSKPSQSMSQGKFSLKDLLDFSKVMFECSKHGPGKHLQSSLLRSFLFFEVIFVW